MSFVQGVPVQTQALPIFILEPYNQFVAAPGNVVEATAEGTLLRSTLADASGIGTTTAAYIELSSAVEAAASGRRIRVVVAARQADENPSPTMAVAYSTASVGNSGWHRFDLTDQFAIYSFTFEVGEKQAEPGKDHIGIWADVEGLGRGVVIGALRVMVEPPGH